MHLLVSHVFEKMAVCCGGLKAFSTFIVLKIDVNTAADGGGRGVVGDDGGGDNGATVHGVCRLAFVLLSKIDLSLFHFVGIHFISFSITFCCVFCRK